MSVRSITQLLLGENVIFSAAIQDILVQIPITYGYLFYTVINPLVCRLCNINLAIIFSGNKTFPAPIQMIFLKFHSFVCVGYRSYRGHLTSKEKTIIYLVFIIYGRINYFVQIPHTDVYLVYNIIVISVRLSVSPDSKHLNFFSSISL